jgi:putative transcriptional regulator
MVIRIMLDDLLWKRRWSKADLIRKTGLRPNTISDLCNEMCDRVSLEQLDIICDALGCSLSDLLAHTLNKVPRVKDKPYKNE